MTDNIKKLLEMIHNNPGLPVVCMVDCDIVCEDYGRWMAQIGSCEISEYATYNDRFYDDREEFTEDYYSRNDDILCERFGYDPRKNNAENKSAEQNLDKYLNEIAEMVFKKAIIVYIDTPDVIEEFKDETDI